MIYSKARCHFFFWFFLWIIWCFCAFSLAQIIRGWPCEGMRFMKDWLDFKKQAPGLRRGHSHTQTRKGNLKFNQINDWRKQEWLKKKDLRQITKDRYKEIIKACQECMISKEGNGIHLGMKRKRHKRKKYPSVPQHQKAGNETSPPSRLGLDIWL